MAVIGINLGGTKITGYVFDNDGNMLHKTFFLLEHKQGREVGLSVKSTIDNLLALYNITDIQSVGICVPVIANSKTGRIWAPNTK